MALTVTVNKFASSNVQAVHRKQKKAPKKSTSATSTNDIGRRGLLLSALVATPPLSDSGAELLKSKVLISSLCLFCPCFFFIFFFVGFSFTYLVVIEICIRVSEEVRREQGQE